MNLYLYMVCFSSALLCGCADDGGVSTGVLRLAATTQSTMQPATLLSRGNCVRFPVLIGAQRDVEYSLEPGLSVRVSLRRDDFSVVFLGVPSEMLTFDRNNPTMSVISPPVPALAGDQMVLVFSSACPATED